MKIYWQCMFSPRLYKIYKDGGRDNMYQPHTLERLGDKVITTVNSIINISIYTSPFICMYIYRRGFFSLNESKVLAQFAGGIGCLIAFSFLLRSIGRVSNLNYVNFVRTLSESMIDNNLRLDSIRNFDFEFHAWPASYRVPQIMRSSIFQRHPFRACANEQLPVYQRIIIQLLAFLATHTFGLRLIYPGSLKIVQNLLWTPLLQGRTQLVEDFDGQRSKIVTADGNALDTMFVDNRSRSPKGNTLVICCEGNSGFYEIGIMNTPIKTGYSALGWNHPGFAGSTGLPYPDQEQNAMNAVMQYAINKLKFQPENIVLFGWSIGGYTATWAAVNYPEVKALILDATFDDLLPLAENQMPTSWSLLVKEVVRTHVNLNIAEMISKYPGPVRLVRRTEDEVICLRQGQLSTNRGNHLLMKLLAIRHPDEMPQYEEVLEKYVALLETQRVAIERNQVAENIRIPLTMISTYTRDYRSTHCTPLPQKHFQDIMDNVVREKGTPKEL